MEYKQIHTITIYVYMDTITAYEQQQNRHSITL